MFHVNGHTSEGGRVYRCDICGHLSHNRKNKEGKKCLVRGCRGRTEYFEK